MLQLKNIKKTCAYTILQIFEYTCLLLKGEYKKIAQAYDKDKGKTNYFNNNKGTVA